MAENISKIYLLNVPIESDYKNTLYFANQTAQYNYFYSRLYKAYPDCSYQRKDQTIRIEAHIDTLYKNCNYVMYQNTAYSNKWFYAFITDMEYVNDGRTNITIQTDVMQTWMFDYTIKSSYIEREHPTSDKIGEHTIPEDLDIGIEMYCNDLIRKSYVSYYVVVASNRDPYNNIDYSGVVMRAGIISGIQWFVFPIGYVNFDDDVKAINDFIKETAKDGNSDMIQSIFAVPTELLPERDLVAVEGQKYYHVKSTLFTTAQGTDSSITIDIPKTLNGYTPKNNKLFSFPYSYILATNNSGSTNIYKYEEFLPINEYDEAGNIVSSEINVRFDIIQVPCEGCSIKLSPHGYKGVYQGIGFIDEGIMCGKFPTFAWSSDSYTNWLTQNAVNMAASVGKEALGILTQGGAGALSGLQGGGGWGALAGAITGTVNGTISTISAVADTQIMKHNASFLPNIAHGNVNGGDVNFASENLGFFFYLMSVKKEYAQSVDDFFTMFGYKCNRVKVPNKNHRKRFWFTKTADINIHGAIPNLDMQIIKNCYNNGITFWKDPADVNNYADPNPIV